MLAAGEAAGIPTDSPRTESPGVPLQPAVVSPADPKWGAALDRARREQQQRETPAAREARARSRTAHAGLADADAIALARRHFPAETRAELPDSRRLPGDTQLVERLDDHRAVVRDGTAQVVMESSLPLFGRTPIHLGLQDDGDALKPASAPARIRLMKQGAAHVRLGSTGLGLRISGRPRTAAVHDGRAFYANVDTDADAFVTPQPNGFELFVQLRSALAPERIVLAVDLPPGARLQRAVSAAPIPGDPPQAVEIAGRDGTLGHVYPPLAYDAEGQLVPSTMEIAGADRLVLHLDHRDRDLMYPVLVDPEVVQYGYGSCAYWEWPGWAWNSSPYNNSRTDLNYFGSSRNDCAYAAGLYQSMPTNNWYTNGAYGQWYYQAPTHTFLYRTVFGNIAHSAHWSHWFHGLMNPSYTAWESNVNYVNSYGQWGGNPFGPAAHSAAGVVHDFCFNPRCDRTQGGERNYAIFGLQACCSSNGGIYTGAAKATNTMGWAHVYLGDRRPPWISSAPGDKGWRDDGFGTTGHRISAHDDGLGIQTITLSGARSGNGTASAPCGGDAYRTSYCPNDWGHDFGYALDEGSTRISTSTQDIVGNPSGTHAWWERIDRSQPSASVYGTFHDARTQASDHRFEGMNAATATLNVDASDAHSGVREIEVYIDGASQRARGGYATGGTLRWTVRPDDYSDGPHQVNVVVRDNIQGHAGAPDSRHVREIPFEVVIDRRGDIYRADDFVNSSSVRVGTDWGKLGVPRARRLTRTYVSTRYDAEERMRTRGTDYDASDEDGFWVRTSDGSDDPNLSLVASMLTTRSGVTESGWTSVTTGTLTGAMQPWQKAPPGRGTQYELRRRSTSKGTTDVWLDTVTRLPVKQTTRDPNGALAETRYWSYDLERKLDSEVPADHFRVARPQRTGIEESEHSSSGGSSTSSTRDDQTGSTFAARSLGPSVQVQAGTFCFARALTHRQRLSGEAAQGWDDPSLAADERGYPGRGAASTGVDAYYLPLPAGATACSASAVPPRLGTPPLMVWTMAAASSEASAWKAFYEREGNHVALNPTDDDVAFAGIAPVVIDAMPQTAYAIRDESSLWSSFLVEAGGVVMIVRGPLLKAEIPALALNLKVM